MPKCIDPVLCYTGQNSRKFRHFSLASPEFKALHQQVFNCGKCIFCRKRKASELAMRCVLHASLYKQNSFLTLTYDEKLPSYHNNFEYSDIQLFKKRLRSFVSYSFDRKIEIFNVHEYGKNGKKHWHLVLFNFDFTEDPDDDIGPRELHTVAGDHRIYRSKRLELLWPFGFSTIGSVTEASAMYQAQYTQKDMKNGNHSNTKRSHSKHSGIGRDYFLRHFRDLLRLGYIPFSGRKAPIPRYFLKLAHRHYCHFYDPSYFFDNKQRKAVYRPFPVGEENREIANLYHHYTNLKSDYLRNITEEWEDFISTSLFSKKETDFQKSGSNYLYDLKNKQSLEEF